MSNMAEKEDLSRLHEPIYLKAARLTYLPVDVRLGDVATVTVNYATCGELRGIHAIIQGCAERGDNVGIGEFDDWEEWYDVVQWATVFSVRRGGELVGGLVLCPYRHSRANLPSTAELFVYLRPELASAGFIPLIQLGEKMAPDLDLNYFITVYHVFFCCQEKLHALSPQGWSISLIIPFTGKVKGGGPISMETCILTKFVGPRTPVPEARTAEFIDIMERGGFLDGEEEFDRLELPQVSGLPQLYRSDGGTMLNLRNLELADHKWLYGLMIAAAERGDGYCIDDFPPYQMWRTMFIEGGHSVVMEVAETKQRIACLQMFPALYNRGPEKMLCDTAIVVDPSYKGRGVGNDLVELWAAFSKELGYRSSMTLVVTPNVRIFAIGRRQGHVWIGTIPCGGNMVGRGWTDSCLSYVDTNNCRSFTEIVRQREAQKAKL